MTLSRRLWLLLSGRIFGVGESLHELAAFYASAVESGVLPTSYRDVARRYYAHGALQGHPGCQYDYGFMLLVGDGIVVDEELGLEWIRKAAAGGYLAAQRLLEDYPQTGQKGPSP